MQLRLYQLKTDTRLLNAPFEEIWKEDKATLQDDLVKVDEFPVYPDTRTEVKFERDPAALLRRGCRALPQPQGAQLVDGVRAAPAPGKGDCMFPARSAPGPTARRKPAAPPLQPHFSIWLDESRIDDGADHLDEYPDASRIRQLYLQFPSSGSGASSRGARRPPVDAVDAGHARPRPPCRPRRRRRRRRLPGGAAVKPRKLVWTEGLFITQHHFQQLDRYHEWLLRRADPRRGPVRLGRHRARDRRARARGRAVQAEPRSRCCCPTARPSCIGDGTGDPVPPRAVRRRLRAADRSRSTSTSRSPTRATTCPNVDLDGKGGGRAERYLREQASVLDVQHRRGRAADCSSRART